MEVFPYSWNTYEEYGSLKIRIFGLNKNNESVFILVEDFKPYLYLELPYIQNLNWGEAKSKVQAISNKIDEVCGKFKPSERKFELKKKLYYAKKHTDKTGKLEDNLYPFLKCYFKSTTDLKQFSYKMKIPLTVSGVGKIQLKTHESDANPVLQFMCLKNIKPASWFKFIGFKIDKEDDKTSSCTHEYIASWNNFIPINKDTVSSPLIMGFDIEVNSSNPNIAPQIGVQEDKIFQISCVVCRNGDKEENYKKYILSLGKNKKGELVDLIPEKVGEDVEIRMFDTEADLLMGFNEIIHTINPQIICGYNIFGFDIPYIYGRTKLNAITSMFDQLSFVRGIHSKEVKIEWSSSAFKNQNFTYLDAPGRLWIDMLPIIQRDYKLENYKLKTVSDFFLGCVDPYTPILLWNGDIKLAKDIIVGDELIGDDGEKRTVQELCKGIDDMYEVTQNSSESYIVNSEHILTLKVSGHLSVYWSEYRKQWEVDYLDREKMKMIKKVFPIRNFNECKENAYKEILKFTSNINPDNIIDIKIKDYLNLHKSLKDKLKGFKSGCINWNKKDVPIDPYIFGLWLGDGDSDGRGLTTNDKEILEKWEEWCNNNNCYITHVKRYNYRIRDNSTKITGKRCASSFKNIIRKYNLFNNKHIPYYYLVNDRDTRLKLLAGLIDTDGHVSESEGIITQVRKVLAENILYLVRSLGFSAKLKTRKTSWMWKNEKKYSLAYEVRFSGYAIEDIPTILPNKKFQKRKQKKDPLVTSISVKNIGKGDYIGWSLDKNKRFLLGDFTVTHNCTKDPLTHKGIFKCYRMFTPDTLSIVAKYCVKDSELVVKLFEKLQIWIGLTEMSNTCNTPIFTLFTQGQQIKIFSQVYKKCMEDNIVIDKDSFIVNENDHFTGAYVFTPVPGLYDMVVSFDFSSLYPSTIIAYNIDYSTLVLDEKIPDEKCNIFEWEDHFNCTCPDTKVVKTKKIVICKKNRFRFLKEPMGIIPTLLVSLIDARKKARKEMEKLSQKLDELKGEEKEQTERMITVLDKRQLAYKVSSNSMYGGMGVKRGYLPFLPGAMCTTARGRQSIEKASKFLVENYGAKLIYGDSVSGDTPILIRYEDQTVDILRIDNIGEVWKPYEEFKSDDIESNRKEKQQTLPFVSSGNYRIMNILEVWTGSEWSKVRRVIRHKTVKKMYRVLTHTGCVDVTEDHSLLDKNLNKIKPSQLNIGSELYHSFPPKEDFLEVEFKDALIEGKVYECTKCNEHKLIFEFYSGYKIKICKKCVYEQNHKIERKTHNKEYISETEYIRNLSRNLNEDLAYVWGMFFAEGSCGSYECKSGTKNSWAINNQDLSVLEKCKSILENCEPLFGWKILDTMASSSVYKLVPQGHIQYIVKKWRIMFYDKEGYKKVPYFILNSNDSMKNQFFSGYYEGDGDKHTFNRIKQFKFDIKGKIGAHGLYTLLYSLGYNVAINTKNKKDNIYTLHTCNNFRKSQTEVKKIIELPETKDDEYVYDIETESGRFLGGIGKIILKNTDSCYISFPQFTTEKDAKNLDMFCRKVEEETSSLFPRPMKFAYEEAIYWRYLILSKKRYMALKCDTDGKVKDKIEKRGVLLSRRDNSSFSRDFYSKIIMKTFHKESFENIVYTIRDELDRLNNPILTDESKRSSEKSLTVKELSISKSIGDIKDYKIKPLPEESCLLCKNKVLTTFYCKEEHDEHNKNIKKCIKCKTKTPYFCKVGRTEKNKEPQYCYSCRDDGMVDIVNKKLQKRLIDLKLFDPESNLPVIRTIFKDLILEKNEEEIENHRINNQLEYQIVEEYLNKALPSQMQLAQKMRKRGTFLTAGERIAYVVIESLNTKDKLFDKIEDLDYFKENKEYINIDKLYYTKLMINPIDEVLISAYNKEDIFKKIHKYKENYYKVMCQLKELFFPRIKLIE
jgi:DNA polymerase elongation subunit (family B)